MAFDSQQGQDLPDLANHELPGEAAGCLEQGAIWGGLLTEETT